MIITVPEYKKLNESNLNIPKEFKVLYNWITYDMENYGYSGFSISFIPSYKTMIYWDSNGNNPKQYPLNKNTYKEFLTLLKLQYNVKCIDTNVLGGDESYKYEISKLEESVLNEGFFDDIEDDIFTDTVDNTLNLIGNDAWKQHQEKVIVPLVTQLLDKLGVKDYTFECTGETVLVHVNGALFLPNKKLNRYSFSDWHFGTVTGDVYFNNNGLTNWDAFPTEIKGNCYALNNKIKNFAGAPVVYGEMFANKQLSKTDYPLTNANYKNRINLHVNENSVYIISKNKFGRLKDINEDKNYCIVKCLDGTIEKCKLNDVNCLTNVTDLLI